MSIGSDAPPLTADAASAVDSAPTLRIQDLNPRSRLTTLFRLLIAIPWLILGGLWGIGALLATVVAWFALVFTGRYPDGLYEFVTGFARYTTRVNAFAFLLVDPYPPFDGAEHPEYPAELRLAPPPASYDRLKVLLRIFYIIPAYIVGYVAAIVTEVVGFVSWLVIIFTGQQSEGLQNALRWGLSWSVRLMLLITLVTETYDLELA
jgi:hypothetical protein